MKKICRFLLKKIKKLRWLNILNLMATVVTIIGIGIIGIWQPIKANIPIIYRNELLDNVEKIKITQSKEYVESLLGTASSISTIFCNNIEIKKNIYVNEYYFLICYFSNDSLNSFLVISRDKKFAYQDYRSGSILLETTIEEAGNNAEGYLNAVEQNVGGRYDSNRFYIETYEQHFYGDDLIVGYALCDIGYWNDEIENDFELAPCILGYELENNITLSNEERKKLIEQTDFRKSTYNTFLASNMSPSFIMEEIIKEYCLGISKGELFNLIYDCNNYKNLYD